MTIETFIQNEVLLPRLQQTGVLVVYDPDRRYRDICLALASDTRRVIDSGESSIESREAALAALQKLGVINPDLEGLLVYVPAPAPLTDEEKQRDPFALYGVVGAVFPSGDGDEYQSLCLKAKADHATEIRRIFAENPDPSFAVINAVGGGAGWPTLQALLGVESARNLLFALLVPSEQQLTALKEQDGWMTEAKALFRSTLGLKLMTRSKNWGPVADELWRYLLFSEFVFDLPVTLPAALTNVPHAEPEAMPVVEDLCDRLRNDRRTYALYIERAETIERELNVQAACASIEDLGVRDTFPFEERSFFAQAVNALKQDDMDKLRQVLGRHRDSVWVGRGENQTQWHLLEAAVDLVEACADGERQLPDHARSQESLIDFYIASLRDVDRLQREFEQAASDYIDPSGQMDEVIAHARRSYRRLIDTVQDVFVRHLESSGWPPAGRLWNADVFDKLVAPKLQESGQRVALLLIDALRYELGVELHKELAEDDQVEIMPAFAQMPTVTPVGMASLLPGAGQNLRLVQHNGQMAPALGDQRMANVTQRMGVLRERYGERFAETTLADFVRNRVDVPAAAELLVIRSNEMDNDFESNPEAAPGLISRTFRQIRGAIHRLRELGFQDAIIVTDHGFYLNMSASAGDACTKPSGNWVNVHERLLLGDGTEDSANYVLPAEHLGIRGDFNQAAGPRAMVAYRTGLSYFHGGTSLQEAIVPVIAVSLRAKEAQSADEPQVTLSYTRESKRITTLLPVIEVTLTVDDLFSLDSSIDVLLEAQDRKGTVVGESKPGGHVNPATRTVSMRPGDTVQVTLKMEYEFEGKFTVKALNPTTLSTYDTLDLETNYTR